MQKPIKHNQQDCQNNKPSRPTDEPPVSNVAPIYRDGKAEYVKIEKK